MAGSIALYLYVTATQDSAFAILTGTPTDCREIKWAETYNLFSSSPPPSYKQANPVEGVTDATDKAFKIV